MKVKLTEICQPKQWNTLPKSKLEKRGYPVYGANGIIGYYNKYNHEYPTILITCRGATCGTVNISKEKAYINGNAMCLDKLSNKVLLKYLYYYLKFYNFKNVISGSAQPQITIENLRKLYVKITDITKQQKIVDSLEKIDKIINIRKKQLEKMNLFVKSLFIEMFGDPIKNPMNWNKEKLENKCQIITGNTPSRKIDNYYGNYIEWIKSDNIDINQSIITKAVEYLSEKGLKVGRCVDNNSILMTCIAGSIKCIGNVAITNRKVAFNQQINAIVPNNQNVWFMYIQFKICQQYIQGSINMSLKGILSKSRLSELLFIFPPMKLQNQFAERVQQIDKSKLAIQQSLEQLKTLKKSLMQEYFG